MQCNIVTNSLLQYIPSLSVSFYWTLSNSAEKIFQKIRIWIQNSETKAHPVVIRIFVSLVSESEACFVYVSEIPAGQKVSTPQSQTEEMVKGSQPFQPSGSRPIRRSRMLTGDSVFQSLSVNQSVCVFGSETASLQCRFLYRWVQLWLFDLCYKTLNSIDVSNLIPGYSDNFVKNLMLTFCRPVKYVLSKY